MKKSKELIAAIIAARKAAGIVMSHYGRTKGKLKKDKSPVTIADRESEKLIKRILSKEFPGYSFIGEESGKDSRKSEYTWIVDPLDGTTNFTVHDPFFNISIALAKNAEPVAGVVYYPQMDELFFSEKGKGAYLNGKRIRVSAEKDMDRAFIMFCHGSSKKDIGYMLNFYRKMKMSRVKVRQLGAAALELCYIAAGRAEAFIMPGANSWDVAAGQLMVREAGGKVTGLDGKDYSINSAGILASNGKLHSRVMGITGRYR